MSDELREASEDGWIAEHRKRYLADGDAARLFDTGFAGGPGLVPTLLLTTTGRRSGRESVMPLIYGECEGGFVIIASRGGDDRHPGWYHNLAAQPVVALQVGSEQMQARARVAEGGEREALWQMMVALYPPFADYQAKTERLIPVVVLVPKSA